MANTIKKAVVDTNILISVFVFPDGLIGEVIDMALKHRIELFTSGSLLAEYMNVLNRKFNWDNEVIAEHMKMIGHILTITDPDISLNVVRADPSDNKVLECAVAAGADAIISGDKHLLDMKKYGTVMIIRPADLLRQLTKQ